IEENGPVRAARLVAAGRVPGRVAAETSARHAEDRSEADLSAIAALGGRLVIPEDTEWPADTFGCFATVAAQADERWRAPVARWRCGCAVLAAWISWVSGRWRWSVPGPRPDTGSTSRLSSAAGSPGADSRWSPAPRSASTAPRTAVPWPLGDSPSRCRRAGWT